MRGRCAARTCFNTEGCRPNLKFFSFPKNPQSCREWVVKCGRDDLLDKPMEQLSKLRLCADHFEKYWFINPQYKTAFIRSGQCPTPTIFRNNLADFMPKSLKKSLSLKNAENTSNKDDENEASHFKVSLDESAQVLVQRSTDNIMDFFRENASSTLSNSSNFPLRADSLNESEDYTVEVKVDGDPAVRNGCYKMCRLCAYLVYEHKLLPLFSTDKTQSLAEKINKFLPGKIKAEDGLPQHACSSCVKRLKECDRIIQLFDVADKKLRRLFCSQKQNCSTTPQEQSTEVVDNQINLHVGAVENSSLLTTAEQLLNAGDELFNVQQSSLLESVVSRNDKAEGNNNGGGNDIAQASELPEVAVVQEGQGEVEKRGPEIVVKAASIHNGEMHLPTEIKVEIDPWIVEYENKTYQCAQCLAEFPERKKLLIHEISDHIFEEKEEEVDTVAVAVQKVNREVISCTDCGQMFGGKKSLRKHIREQHIPTDIICEFCGAHYQSYSKLLVHRRLHTSETPFCCETCGSKFRFQKELRIHRRTHVQSSPFMCRACGKQCPTRNSLWQHEKTHNGDRIALCPQCGKVLSNPQSLRVHMRTHSSDRPCSCPTCGKSFKDNASVAKHMLMHSASKDYACDVCGRAFYSKALVKQHKLSHSGVRPHRCDICGAAYNRLGNLNQHKKKHRGTDGVKETLPSDLPHECVVCGKRMRSELTLKYHLAKHTGEKKPFDCEVCGKRFVAVAPYRVHMRIHTGERPYECPTCSKTFRSSFTLKQHQALHKDECPYACPYCERKFKRLQSLVVHRRTHTGEKPHRCPTCARAFAQKGDMLKHTKTHTRERNSLLSTKAEKLGPIVMEIEQISDLALSDSEMTSEFLIDMPIVEVETEINSDINAEIA